MTGITGCWRRSCPGSWTPADGPRFDEHLLQCEACWRAVREDRAWSARLSRLGLCCINGQTSELVAASIPAAELATIPPRLPLS